MVGAPIRKRGLPRHQGWRLSRCNLHPETSKVSRVCLLVRFSHQAARLMLHLSSYVFAQRAHRARTTLVRVLQLPDLRNSSRNGKFLCDPGVQHKAG